MIDKDTKLFCSFSGKAGSLGCKVFNQAFRDNGINAIYKSFSVTSIKYAVQCMPVLGIEGAAVSMPFKQQVLKHCHHLSPEVHEIGAANTVLCEIDYLTAYNTDWLAARDVLQRYDGNLCILGGGGYSRAVQYASRHLGKEYSIITRDTWNEIENLRDCIVFNATPVENIQLHQSCTFIDCNTDTEPGKELALIQASYQFKLYTGLDMSWVLYFD